MLSKDKKIELEIYAAQIRIEALHMIHSAKKGHVGGTMSVADVVAVLYGKEMNVKSQDPRWEFRDRLVMSKGHCGCAIYAALALKDFFPGEWRETLNALGTRLPSHCDRTKTPGIDMSTGSLGQGLSAASGIAWANEKKGRNTYTYCILGDGECQEGQVWEALMFAGYHRQSHLIAFVDGNKKQVDGYVGNILPVDNLDRHAELFGWYVQRIQGHDMEQIVQAVENAKAQKEKPSLIYLETVKGKDCVFAENVYFNHGIGVDDEQLKEATEYLQEKIVRIKSEVEG